MLYASGGTVPLLTLPRVDPLRASSRLLTRLRAIVETARRGNPFLAENAARLRSVAWAVLGLEVLHLAAGLVTRGVLARGEALDLDWSFSITRPLCVFFLFVLAQVFEHGAALREDVEGTV